MERAGNTDQPINTDQMLQTVLETGRLIEIIGE